MYGKIAVLLLGLLIPWAGSQAEAQVFSLTPTYQSSFQEWDADLDGSTLRAWGVMATVDRRGSRLSPHLWMQQYELGTVCEGSFQGRDDCRIKGWQFSIGPSIQLLPTDRVGLAFLPNVGFDTGVSSGFAGGAGLHLDVRVGRFKPQVMGRFQYIKGRSFGMVGVGVSYLFLPPG